MIETVYGYASPLLPAHVDMAKCFECNKSVFTVPRKPVPVATYEKKQPLMYIHYSCRKD